MNHTQKLNNLPIGIFDSGVGGLTVVKAVMERLPQENIIYFGDTARVPYGIKSTKTIQLFTGQVVDFLMEKKIKALVVACNTISAAAIEVVKEKAKSLPTINVIEAGVKQALLVSPNKQIGVIATSTTVNSGAYARSIAMYSSKARVVSKACPLLVPLIEEDWLNNDIARLTVREYLHPLLVENIDTLILGCTHYPLIKPLIFSELGANIRLVDSAIAVAEKLSCSLAQAGLLKTPTTDHGEYHFYVSDIPLRFQAIAEKFLGRSIKHLQQNVLE